MSGEEGKREAMLGVARGGVTGRDVKRMLWTAGSEDQ